MDVFAFLRKINPDGSVETASRGMLKVSHRQLDAKLSTPFRPYHTHAIEQKLKIYTGADRASYVQLPIVPAKPGTQLTTLGGIKVGGGGGE